MKSNLNYALALGMLVLLLAGLTVFLKSASKPFEDGETNKSAEITNPAMDYSAIRESISQINKKIDKLDLSIAKLGQNLESTKNKREEKLTAAPPINSPSPIGLDDDRKPMEKPTDWLSGLDSGTRVRVNNIFKQNASRMREAMKNIGSIENTDRKTMQEIFEGNQESLKNELKEVLSPEDYERFLNSLPPPPAPPDLTALPENKQ
jgi:t-SNARE complex subunit (syntaxin)